MCADPTLVSPNIKTLTSADMTLVATADKYDPLTTSIASFLSIGELANQTIRIVDAELKFKVASGTALIPTYAMALIYTGSTPTTPTSGTPYDASDTDLLCAIQFDTSGVNIVDVSDKIKCLRGVLQYKPQINYYNTLKNDSTGVNLYAVLIQYSTSSFTPASGETVNLKLSVERCVK